MHDLTLLQSLDQDIAAAARLLELTGHELQALEQRDLETLEQLLEEKQPLLAQLAEHGRQRSQLMHELNLSNDRTGLQALASQSGHGAELLASADRLGQLLEDCQNANQVNGRIIRSSQSSLNSVLDILRGSPAGADLYDRHGGTQKAPGQLPLTRA